MTHKHHILHVSDNSFEEHVLKSSVPVLLDFWAPWCGPCRALEPIYLEVAEAYAGKVTFAKIDIDENPETPAKHGVRSITTLMLFKAGQVIATKVGSLSKKDLSAFVDSYL